MNIREEIIAPVFPDLEPREKLSKVIEREKNVTQKRFFGYYPYAVNGGGVQASTIPVKKSRQNEGHELALNWEEYNSILQAFFEELVEEFLQGKGWELSGGGGWIGMVRRAGREYQFGMDPKKIKKSLKELWQEGRKGHPIKDLAEQNGFVYQLKWIDRRFRFHHLWTYYTNRVVYHDKICKHMAEHPGDIMRFREIPSVLTRKRKGKRDDKVDTHNVDFQLPE